MIDLSAFKEKAKILHKYVPLSRISIENIDTALIDLFYPLQNKKRVELLIFCASLVMGDMFVQVVTGANLFNDNSDVCDYWAINYDNIEYYKLLDNTFVYIDMETIELIKSSYIYEDVFNKHNYTLVKENGTLNNIFHKPTKEFIIDVFALLLKIESLDILK